MKQDEISCLSIFFCFGTQGGESIFPKPTQEAAAEGPGWEGDWCSGEWTGAQQTAQWGSAGERDSPGVSELITCLNHKDLFNDTTLLIVNFCQVKGCQRTWHWHIEPLALLVMTHWYTQITQTRQDHGGNIWELKFQTKSLLFSKLTLHHIAYPSTILFLSC